VMKEGARGITMFFKSHVQVLSRDFKINGKTVLQILSDGRQSVLPPSIHPDTGRPYFWTSKFSLYDLPHVDDLSSIPHDYIERIEKIVSPLGYKPEAEKKPFNDADEDDSFRALNRRALFNLSAWVPDLNLYKCARKKQRGSAAFEAVATWRPSNKGRPNEERNTNLSITRAGITDWGDGQKGYSPINLVMAARQCDRSEAIGWLQERVYKSDVEIDFDALLRSAPHVDGAPNTAKSGAGEEGAKTREESGGDFDEVPSWWGPGGWVSTNSKPPAPHIIHGTVPLLGVGLVSGQTGSAKTWVTAHLSACTMMEWPFAGMHVEHPGGVLYFEVEGSNIDTRIRAACQALGKSATELPFLYSESLGPLFMKKRIDRTQSKILSDKIVWAQKAMMARFQQPLRLVVLDTFSSITGVEEHNEGGENAAFMNFCGDLAKKMNVFILICDHMGKNIEAGTRGSSAKEGRADAVLAVIGKPEQRLGEPRLLRWRKMRNAVSGREIQFRLNKVPVEIGGTLVDSCAVEFLLDSADIRAAEAAQKSALSSELQLALNTLTDSIRRHPVDLPPGADLAGLKGTLVSSWREAWRAYQAAVCGKDQGSSERFRKQWQRTVATLKLAGAINLAGEIVWSPSSYS
jgi:hypothetical protein